MKKIVLALALGIACLVQASSVKWGLLSPVDAGGNKYRVWTFVAADSSGTTAAGKLLSLADAISMLENGDWATLKTYNTKAGTLATDGTFSSATTADNDKWVAGVTLSGYAIIFDSTDKNLTGVTKYMVTDVVDITFANAADSKTLGVTPTGTWARTPSGDGDVPEPTSGLLLLVGGAVMALRRRR